jgi:hypothetical protein
LQSERAAAIVKSLNFKACPPLGRIGPETIPQQNENCAANPQGPVPPSELFCAARNAAEAGAQAETLDADLERRAVALEEMLCLRLTGEEGIKAFIRAEFKVDAVK